MNKKGRVFMADKLTKEDIRQAFFDMAAEMERECGDWQSLPETDDDRALKERILKIVKEKLDDSKRKN